MARWPLATATLIVVVAAGVGGGLLYQRSHRSVIPAAVQKEVVIPILIPGGRGAGEFPVSKLAYDASLGRLTYRTAVDGVSVDVSEQATPDGFLDVPQAYDKLIASLQEYASFGSPQGTVSLTHPKELKGVQSAVMNAKGTLLFARPAHDLSENQWRRLFNSLIVQN